MIQLSLFDEYPGKPLRGAISPATSTGRLPSAGTKARQKHADVMAEANSRKANRVREQRPSGTLYLPFDDPEYAAASVEPALEAVVSPPAPQPRPAIIERPATPVNLDMFADLVEEEEPATAARIAFDPLVWQLRPDSGDFIHIRTGEVREEDEFLPMDMAEALEEFPEWIEPVD